MKHLSIIFCFFSFVGYSQVGRIYDLNEYNQPEVGSIYVQFDDNYSDFWACIDFHDTMKTVFNTDTADFRNVLKILLPGTSSQYLRGDGVLTTFPSIPTNTNQLTNGAGFITGYTESDPAFSAHAAAGITSTLIGNWNAVYSWGNHASVGYLTGFTEIDGSTTNEIELPSQTGNAGKYLTTNGSTVSWVSIKRQETYSGTTNASGIYSVTFGASYATPPNIQVTLIGSTNVMGYDSVAVSETGFSVHVYSRTYALGLAQTPTNVSGLTVSVLVTES